MFLHPANLHFVSLLQQAIEDGQTDLQLSFIMDTWVLQMGYPVVTLQRCQPTNIKVTQHHFLINPANPPDGTYAAPFK